MLWAALVWTLGACSGADPEAESGLTVRDSAGVSIVTHSAAFVASLPVWTLDSVPLERIDGNSAENAFSSVTQAARYADGRVVTFDARQRELREFSPEGALLRIVARGGRGPGEIGYVSRLQLLDGDTVAFVDQNERRISYVLADGTVGAQYNFPRFDDGTRVQVHARMADGRVLGSLRTPPRQPTEANDAVFRRPFALVAFDGPARDSASARPRVDTIAVLPGAEEYAGYAVESGEEFLSVEVYRLGRSTHIGTNGDRLFVGTNERQEIAEYGVAGLKRLIRTNAPPRPITDSVKQYFRDGFAALTRASGAPPSISDEYIENLNRWRIADEFEYYYALRVGSDGTLWVEEPWILPDEPRRYVVHDTSGRAIARAELPPRVTPLGWSATDVLGVWKDALDIPHVMRWRLRERQ